jgi:peptidyl-prolyl cis-trans isomerase SurA
VSKRNRRRIVAIVAAAFAVVALRTPAHPQEASTQTDSGRLLTAVVAAVDGQPITLSDLDAFSRGRGLLLPEAEQATRQSLLEALVRSQLFEMEFKAEGLAASDRDVDIYIDNFLAQSGSDRAQLQAALDDLGVPWDEYFARMREEMQRHALIDREIRSRVSVTEEEINRHWEQSTEFDLPSRVELADIYIALPEDPANNVGVREAHERARLAHAAAKREGFAEAARLYSQGPNADDGGNLGEFARGTLAPEFEDIIKGLDPGDISEPFEAAGGLHIIQLVRTLEGGRVPLEQVQEKIRAKLYADHMDERFTRWVEQDLRGRHYVVLKLDQYESLPRWQP